MTGIAADDTISPVIIIPSRFAPARQEYAKFASNQTPVPFPGKDGEMNASMTTDNIITGQKVSPTMWQTAKQLRRRMTSEEQALWEHLRAKRLAGLRFRRQQVIDRYVVDLYCHAAGIVVEVDGPAHLRQVECDQERDAVLAASGLRTLRFRNEQIQDNLPVVLKQIADACHARLRTQT